MKKPNFSELWKSAKTTISIKSPAILAILGISGMAVTVMLVNNEAPKAKTLRKEIEERYADKPDEKWAKRKEIATTVVPLYFPATAMFIVSSGCIVGSLYVNDKRNAGLAAAYTMTKTALKEYQSTVKGAIGEKKELAIRDSIAQNKVSSNPPNNSEVIVTRKGETLFYDTISARYFKSDIDRIKAIQNNLNYRLLSEMYISLNDFYYEVGLPSIKIGDDLGWSVNQGLLDIRFSATINDDQPCIVLEYTCEPQYDYNKLS